MKWVRLGYCPKCGKDVDADYCDECGAYTQEPVEEDEPCRSTISSAEKGTDGKSFKTSKARREKAVRSARRVKESVRRSLPK